MKSQVNIIWSLSELNYKNEALTKKIEELILKNACNYDLPVKKILLTYNLLIFFLKKEHKFNFWII